MLHYLTYVSIRLYFFGTLDGGDMHSDSFPLNVLGDMAVSIRKDGTVRIEGVVKGATCPANAVVWYEQKMQEFPPSACFSTAFHLPGPVDPRLTSCSFKHGILDCTVMKFRLPPYFPNGNL